VLFIALEDDGTILGVLVAAWRNPHVSLSQFERRAIDLIKREAAHAMSRLRTTQLLQTQAGTDVLTGLANRRVCQQALVALHPGDAVVMIDLDHFKAVNDRFGHVVGDDVLKSLADCMRQVGRKSDCIARYGGEEFALVLKDAEYAGAGATLKRLIQLWTTTNPLTTFSAGVAIHDAGDPPAVTLERADAALYRAKQMGRNRVEHADDPMEQEPSGPRTYE
jgi:diguanylate cyclase (GGDEF)-like protein